MRILAAAIVVTATLVFPAWADQPDAQERCAANSPMPPQQRLESCTAAIEGGQHSRQSLAMAYDRRANVYLNLRDYERAIADFDQAVALDPKLVNALINRGMALCRKGRFDAAIRDFDRALGLNSRTYGALFGRGLAYQEKARWDFDAYLNEGRYEDLAIRDYDQALELSPKSAPAYNNRANARASRREYDLALQDYQKAVEFDPNNALYYKNRGNIFRILGRYDRAVADYRKALSIKPEESIKKQLEGALKELGLAG
jgi:tetratricopeptide (TPR) repeat protein